MPNAKQYYENLEKKYKELQEKLENLKEEAKSNPKLYFVEPESTIESLAAGDKITNFYDCIIKRIPEDKKKEVNEYLKSFYFKNPIAKQVFESKFGEEFRTSGKLEYEFFTLSSFGRNKAEIIDRLSSFLSEKDIEDAIKENEQFVSPTAQKRKVKLFDKEIKEAKEFLEANEKDPAKKEEILKELDLINETVVGANEEYRKMVHNRDSVYESGRNKIKSQEMTNYVEKNKPESSKFLIREVHDYFKVNADVMKQNANEYKNFRENSKLNLGEQNKAKTVEILKAFEKFGIYDPIDNGNEQSTKVYGFRQIFNAHHALRKAIENHDFSKLKQLRENYAQSIENMKEIFALTKKLFNPTPENMVGNLNNHRHSYVPYDLVDDIATNSTVSSLYNIYAITKKVGCTPEEFVDDPLKYLLQFREVLKNNLNIDKKSQGKSIAQTLSLTITTNVEKDPDSAYPAYSLPRVIEGLVIRETDPEIKGKLHYNGMFFCAGESEFAHYVSGHKDKQSYFAKQYLDVNPAETIANVLLVNDKDRVYSKLRAHEYYDINDDLTILKPFDTKEYLISNIIDPVELKNRIINTAKEIHTIANEKIALIKKDGRGGQGKMTADIGVIQEFVEDFTRGAQQAIQLYLLLGNHSLSNKGISDLAAMLKDPTKMLDGMKVSKELKNTMNEFKNKDQVVTDIKNNEKEYKTFIANERKAESEFNKKANKLLYDSVDFDFTGTENTAQKLIDLKEGEKNRLKELFEKHVIPKDYYEKRIELIDKDNFDEKVPLFDDGILNKKDYIKSTGLEELTKEEMDGLYESYKLKIEHEKQIFISSKYLYEREEEQLKNKYIESTGLEELTEEEKNSLYEAHKLKMEYEKQAKEETKTVQKEQPKIQKISIPLDDETDIQSTTKINDVSKQKTIDKNNDLNV